MTNAFIHRKIQIEDCLIDIEIAGIGPPILLLHGFPETKLAWKNIAPDLVADHTVILPDIPGYGASTAPVPSVDYSNFSKRSMGNIMNLLMKQLGFDTYYVAGHDRGARIAYRMAIDHPEQVKRLAVLNIIPTIEVAERINYDKAYNMENWFFLSQPAPFPETLINANPEFYLNHILDSWSVNPQAISKETRAEYLSYFKQPAVIEKICAEYRAFKLDIQYDNEDRIKHKKMQCPTLVLWSQNDFPSEIDNPLKIWNDWADHATGKGLLCGHFLMEERPLDVMNEFSRFFMKRQIDK